MPEDAQNPPPNADGATPAPSGVGAAVGRFFEALAARVRDVVPKAGEEDFRTLADTIPQLAWVAEADGYVFWYNKRWHDYTGLSFEQAQGWGWREVLHPDHAGSVAASLQHAFETGEAWEDTFPLRGKDGQYRWFLSRALPLRDGQGRVTRWYGTNTDVTDQRRFEAELAAAKAAAEEANRAKSQFLATMSHELRTPLSAIIGYSEMLEEEVEEGADAGELLPDLRKIEANARHLLGLINDVLDLSKVEAGRMEVYPETFEAEPMLRELAATVQGLMEKNGNALELQLAPGLGAMRSDVTKVRQVLLNLLSNAAKFTENGTITLSAQRGAGPGGGGGQDWLTFRVSDTGIGMTEEQLGKLFQRFQQADASTTRRFGGTGLGLALTKALSVMLGGDVEVESAPGRGSAFTVRLPAAHEEHKAAKGEQDPASQGGGATAEGDGAAVANCVLVVDDDPATRDLLSRFLEREGFAARTASDGRAGLGLAKQLRPRAILLDVLMPGMDGWSVLSALKADPELARIPVVMVTFAEERGLAAALGAADYVPKPVRWERFRRVMDRFREASGDVLVVDDDPDLRRRIRALLEEDGWTVAEAGDGAEALERVARAVPRLVLLDLAMPVMDGFAFLQALRERPGCADIPVVVLTARDLTGEERRRLRGASQVLDKGDTDPRELAERLRALAAPPASGGRADAE
jgi:PAS domain S-box-containing protein